MVLFAHGGRAGSAGAQVHGHRVRWALSLATCVSLVGGACTPSEHGGSSTVSSVSTSAQVGVDTGGAATDACEVGLCVADTIALPALVPVEAVSDVRMAPTLSALAVDRVWVGGDSTGLFGRGWASIWDVRVEGALLRGVLPAAPISPASENGEVTLADGTRVRFGDGAVTRVCPAAALCVEAERSGAQLTLVPLDVDASVVLSLVDGRVVTASASDGRRADFTYVDGALTEVVGAAGTTFYGYEGGRLVSIQAPNDSRTFVYDADGRVSTSMDRDGGTWQFRSVSKDTIDVVTPDGSTLTHRFVSGTLVETSSAEKGLLLLRTFDENGLLREERPLDGVSMERIDVGVMRVTQRAEGAPPVVSNYEFDALSRLAQVESASGVVEYEYIGDTSLVSKVTSSAGSTQYTYDERNLLIGVVDPDGYSIEVDRDATGAPVRIGDGVTATAFSYDAEGHVVEQRTGSEVIGASYLPVGLVDQITDARGSTTSYRYDERGRLTAAQGPSSATFSYGPDGHLSGNSVTDELPMLDTGGVGESTSIGDPVVAVNSDGTSTYTYDDSTTVTFDEWARPLVVSVDGQTTTREYDELGQLTSLSYSTGLRYDMTYTAAGRVATLAANGASFEMSWHGDLLVGVSGPNDSDYEFEYDEGGRLVRATHGEGRWDYTYDEAGNLARVDAPDGSTSYEWNEAGLPTASHLGSGRSRSYEWDGSDLERVIEASGDEIVLSRDDQGRLQSMESDAGAFTLTYDPDGRVATFRLPDGRDGSVIYGDHGVASLQLGDHFERWDYEGGRVAMVTLGNGHRYFTGWASPGVLSGVSKDGEELLTAVVEGGLVQRYVDDDGDGVASFDWRNGVLRGAEVGDDSLTIDRDEEGRITRATADGLDFAAGYDAGLLSEVRLDDQALEFEYVDGRLAASTYRTDEKAVNVEWDSSGSIPVSFDSDDGRGAFRYADGRVVEISYDDQVRPVSYGDDGEPSAEGTGGEFLDDLFDDAGRFRGIDASVGVGPWSPLLSALPAELGMSLPSVVTADAVVGAALDVAVPATPLPIIADESKVVKSAIDQVIAAGAQVDLPFGPSARVVATLAPTGTDVAGLLASSPSASIGDSVLSRLAGDPCLLCRVPSFGASLLSGLGGVATATKRFILDNPIVRSLLTSAFIIWQSLMGAACGAIPYPVVGRVCGIVVALEGIVVGEIMFGDPSNLAALLRAALVDPFRPLVAAVADLDAVAVVSAVAPILSQVAVRKFAVGRAVSPRLAAAACKLERVGCLSASRYPSAATHALDAQPSVGGMFVRVNRTGTDQRRTSALRGIAVREGFDRDEWPPAFLRSDRSPVSVNYIDPSDNRGAGSSLRNQLAGLPDRSFALLLVTP